MSEKKLSSQLPHACGICGDLCSFGSLGIKICAFLKFAVKLKKHLLFCIENGYFPLKASQIPYSDASFEKCAEAPNGGVYFQNISFSIC